MSTPIGQDLVAYLSSKGIHTYRAAGREVQAHCLWCEDGDPKAKGRLYLNTDSWLYSCFRCLAKGNRKTLLEHFGDDARDDVTWVPGSNPAMARKALTEATALGQEMLLNNPKVLTYLVGRGLSEQTIDDARIGYVPAGWSLVSPLLKTNDVRDLRAAGLATPEGQSYFSGQILIPYIHHGDVVMMRGRAFTPGKVLTGPKYVSPTAAMSRFYGVDDLMGARDAVIVEGEFDRLALKQALMRSSDPVLRATAVVGVAGVNTLPEGFASYFQECRRVYLGLDPDDAGSRGLARMREMLGTKTRTVELPTDLPKADWSDYLQPRTEGKIHSGHTWRDAQNLLEMADAAGRTLYTPGDLQRQWTYVETVVGGAKIGLAGFDRLVPSGIRPGQLLIPLAATGAGKTSFLATLIYNMRQRPTLVVSLELTGSEFWDRLRRVAHFWDPDISDDQIKAEFSKLRVFDRRLKPNDLQRLAEEYEDDCGESAQVIHVDYLGYAAKNWAGNSNYERLSRCVQDIKEDAKAVGAVVVAPQQINRGNRPGEPLDLNSARDAGAIEETADYLVGLYRPGDTGQQVDNTVILQILKTRGGGLGKQIPLLFSNASLVLVDKTDNTGTRNVETENIMVARGEVYSTILHNRRTAVIPFQPTLTVAR